MIYDGDDILLCKTKKVVDLEEKASNEMTSGTIGLVIRVGTHGVPNDVNSHPHLSNSGDLVIITMELLRNCP
jgi:glucosamine--fructose-6-phosphate aminotransferase (isomerizing)